MELHRHTLLLVDDNLDWLSAVTTGLTLSGIDVHAAASGPEALDALVGGLKPCLVLLDIRMPRFDGWQIWEQMRRMPERVDTPVVIVSGETADTERAAHTGIRAYLQKPIALHALEHAIGRFCAVAGSDRFAGAAHH